MGTALLLAAVDKQGPQLYLIEPSGTGLVRSIVCRLMMRLSHCCRCGVHINGRLLAVYCALLLAEVLRGSRGQRAAGCQDRDRAVEAGRADVSPGRHGGRQDVSPRGNTGLDILLLQTADSFLQHMTALLCCDL